MKTSLFIKPSLAIIMSLFVLSCTKESQISNDNYLTEEIEKIETVYHEGDIKVEGLNAVIEPETYASEALRGKIRKELDESYNKQASYINKGNSLWAVFSYNGCNSYKSLNVFMDCQDGGNSYTANSGQSYADANKNMYLKFCVLPDFAFAAEGIPCGALNLTADYPEGINKLKIYMDNEDTKNKNVTTYNGNTYYGWWAENWFGSNTQLTFGINPGLGNEGMLQGPIPHLLLGNYSGSGYYNGTIFSDDENTSNANSVYLSTYNYNTLSWNSWTLCPNGYSGYCSNTNTNTTLYLVTRNN